MEQVTLDEDGQPIEMQDSQDPIDPDATQEMFEQGEDEPEYEEDLTPQRQVPTD